MELMQKLSKTQQIQQKAFEELQTALVLPSKEFQKKFNIGEKKKRKRRKKKKIMSQHDESSYQTTSNMSRKKRLRNPSAK